MTAECFQAEAGLVSVTKAHDACTPRTLCESNALARAAVGVVSAAFVSLELGGDGGTT